MAWGTVCETDLPGLSQQVVRLPALSSIGCIAIEDGPIEELYLMTLGARSLAPAWHLFELLPGQ
ncbi:hypothetical protein [Archangium sp.]|uniref:hypothetical protein n=1 Tax=Archangium sp. TaxID=1872627 RepID=UPI002D3F73C2|nr:hypothetical protein [Archangium sp.]HYO55731.1 hypothetical protein [Archangium sp.]